MKLTQCILGLGLCLSISNSLAAKPPFPLQSKVHFQLGNPILLTQALFIKTLS
ncbi:hypothetical protein [Pelistega europaea]|uniref:hypothetical protein n=1 Tax=Pelistega europaea TaxID=106147 RepID=UPI0014912DFC|nr:hypothetical protein [Pelistega europaea]